MWPSDPHVQVGLGDRIHVDEGAGDRLAIGVHDDATDAPSIIEHQVLLDRRTLRELDCPPVRRPNGRRAEGDKRVLAGADGGELVSAVLIRDPVLGAKRRDGCPRDRSPCFRHDAATDRSAGDDLPGEPCHVLVLDLDQRILLGRDEPLAANAHLVRSRIHAVDEDRPVARAAAEQRYVLDVRT